MNQPTIADLYAKNDKIRQELKDAVSNLTDEQANILPEGEKWTLLNFLEHVAVAEEGMSKISYMLLSKAKAEGKTSDGMANFTANFIEKSEEIRDKKLKAPETVHPKGDMTIAESLAKMDENRKKLNELQTMFETVEAAEHTYPHPYIGEMNAAEWLALIGGHEARHLKQIEKFLEKIN